jgi:hypothetical protein
MNLSFSINRLIPRRVLAVMSLAIPAFFGLRAADQPLISVMTFETDNVVTYVGDVTDPSILHAGMQPEIT